MLFDRRVRKCQQLSEIFILLLIFVVSFTFFMMVGLEREKIPKTGLCLSPNQIPEGTITLTQRMFEYFFKPRYKGDFVFSINSFYRTMGIMSMFTAHNSLTELRSALSLPCDPEVFLNSISSHFEFACFQPLHSHRFSGNFLQKLNITHSQVYGTRWKFYEAMNSQRPPHEISGNQVPTLLSKNLITFKSHYHDLVLAIANKMELGDPAVDSDTFGNSEVAEELIIEAERISARSICFQVYKTKLRSKLSLTLFHFNPKCSQKLSMEYLSRENWQTFLWADGNEQKDPADLVRLKLSEISLKTSLKMDVILQVLNVIEMFDLEKSKFSQLIDEEKAQNFLSVKSVKHEAVLHLRRSHFNVVHGEDATADLCNSSVMLILQKDEEEILAFARIFNLTCV